MIVYYWYVLELIVWSNVLYSFSFLKNLLMFLIFGNSILMEDKVGGWYIFISFIKNYWLILKG